MTPTRLTKRTNTQEWGAFCCKAGVDLEKSVPHYTFVPIHALPELLFTYVITHENSTHLWSFKLAGSLVLFPTPEPNLSLPFTNWWNHNTLILEMSYKRTQYSSPVEALIHPTSSMQLIRLCLNTSID